MSFVCLWCKKTFGVSRDRVTAQTGKYCSTGCYFASRQRPLGQDRLNRRMDDVFRMAIRENRSFPKLYSASLGYDSIDLREKLQTAFSSEMNWENHGSVWHVDHIMPKSLFEFTSVYDNSFRECWGLRNLRPLLRSDNVSRGGGVSFLRRMTVISFDNGTTGSYAVFHSAGDVMFRHTPVFRSRNYTKQEQYITRINTVQLREELCSELAHESPLHVLGVIERPMVNPGRFKATISAVRALEATELLLESLHIPYAFLDSKEWQQYFLGDAVDLKHASLSYAKEKFKSIDFGSFEDADGLLIGSYFREKLSWKHGEEMRNPS